MENTCPNADFSPKDSDYVLSEPLQKKKRTRRKCEGKPRERIIEHFEKLSKPTTWLVLKDIIPGNKSEIWKVLNKMVSENLIIQSGGGKRGNPYYFELPSTVQI